MRAAARESTREIMNSFMAFALVISVSPSDHEFAA